MAIVLTQSGFSAASGNSIQLLVDRARIPLNDADKDRYKDVELLAYVNDAILLLRKHRPDLFLGRYSSLPEFLLLTDDFPVAREYLPAVIDYVTGRAELVDDENVDNARSMALIQSFMTGIRA